MTTHLQRRDLGQPELADLCLAHPSPSAPA